VDGLVDLMHEAVAEAGVGTEPEAGVAAAGASGGPVHRKAPGGS